MYVKQKDTCSINNYQPRHLKKKITGVYAWLLKFTLSYMQRKKNPERSQDKGIKQPKRVEQVPRVDT